MAQVTGCEAPHLSQALLVWVGNLGLRVNTKNLLVMQTDFGFAWIPSCPL